MPVQIDKKWVRRIAVWLPRLADSESVEAAGAALIEVKAAWYNQTFSEVEYPEPGEYEVREQAESALLAAAVETLDQRLEVLIPAWIRQFLQSVQANVDYQASCTRAFEQGNEIPELDMSYVLSSPLIEKTLVTVGDRIDAHLGPIVDALSSANRESARELYGLLQGAGPAVVAALPALLKIARRDGIWNWPDVLGKVLARVSNYTPEVVRELRLMLATGQQHEKETAIQLLGAVGENARDAFDEIIAHADATEDSKCVVLSALAGLGDPRPELLDLIEASLRDVNGYVRRAAAHAIGHLRAAPHRFVPLLIEACDDQELLHDESLPEAAISALAAYGQDAAAAAGRLREFLEGPIDGRTVNESAVRNALKRIGSDTPIKSTVPPRREEPVDPDEPLLAVRYQKSHCYIDRAGRLVIGPGNFDYGGPFVEDRAIVHRGDETFVIDRTGQVVFRSDFDEIKAFCEGFAAVLRDEKWGFVDRDGRVVVEPQYDSVMSFSEGLAGVQLGQKEETIGLISFKHEGAQGFIDSTGRAVIPMLFQGLMPFAQGRAVVCTSGELKENPLDPGRTIFGSRKYGYLARDGRLAINGKYDFVRNFSDGLAAVTIGEVCGRSRCGYINHAGEVAIPLEFTTATSFRGGLAVVHRRGKRNRGRQFVIDTSGRTVLESELRIEPFSEGLAAAHTGKSWGVIDISGKFVIPAQFDQIEAFRDGLAEVHRGDWYGIINQCGDFIWGPTTEGQINRTIEPEWH